MPIACANKVAIPHVMTSLTGKVSSIAKLNPIGIIGKMAVPRITMLARKYAKFLEGKLQYMVIVESKQMAIRHLRNSKNFLDLSSKEEKIKDPMTPQIRNTAPTILDCPVV